MNVYKKASQNAIYVYFLRMLPLIFSVSVVLKLRFSSVHRLGATIRKNNPASGHAQRVHEVVQSTRERWQNFTCRTTKKGRLLTCFAITACAAEM